MRPYRKASVSPEIKALSLRSGYFIVTLQQSRPTSSNEGRKMVQQTILLWSPDLAKLNPNCHMNYIFICNYLQKRFDLVPQVVIELGGNNSTKMTTSKTDYCSIKTMLVELLLATFRLC